MPTQTTANCNRMLGHRGIPFPKVCLACGEHGPCLYQDEMAGDLGDRLMIDDPHGYGGARVVIEHGDSPQEEAQAKALATVIRAVAPAICIDTAQRAASIEGEK